MVDSAMPATVARHPTDSPVEPAKIDALMRSEGLAPYRWDNGPGFIYAPHRHAYHKVLCCVRGSIRFDLTREGESIELQAGDRLDLTPDTEHGALVGPDGVVCLEAQR
jgi:hypothetical protein